MRVRTAAVDPALLLRLDRERPDLVVLDPPRAGLGVAAAQALARLRPRALAYVSCDAASFARDRGCCSTPAGRSPTCGPWTSTR